MRRFKIPQAPIGLHHRCTQGASVFSTKSPPKREVAHLGTDPTQILNLTS